MGKASRSNSTATGAAQRHPAITGSSAARTFADRAEQATDLDRRAGIGRADNRLERGLVILGYEPADELRIGAFRLSGERYAAQIPKQDSQRVTGHIEPIVQVVLQ
mgnify:CR=1 FL=1